MGWGLQPRSLPCDPSAASRPCEQGHMAPPSCSPTWGCTMGPGPSTARPVSPEPLTQNVVLVWGIARTSGLALASPVATVATLTQSQVQVWGSPRVGEGPRLCTEGPGFPRASPTPTGLHCDRLCLPVCTTDSGPSGRWQGIWTVVLESADPEEGTPEDQGRC